MFSIIITDDTNITTTRFGSGNIDGFNMIGLLLPGVAVTYNGEEIGKNHFRFSDNHKYADDCDPANHQE